MAAAPEVIAAVDLGSNSFHLVVARHSAGTLTIIDRLREMVRLAGGLDDQGYLSAEAQQRALDCLERFGQRIRDFHADNVRAVGTNTLRRARNRKQFLAQAERALGFEINVVSGVEEARLVYLGAAHTLPAERERRLVVDIGGGSTELIIGEGLEPLALESLYVGCVGLSSRFFGNGRITAERVDAARVHVRLELRPIKTAFRNLGWASAVGTSGTIRTIQEILREGDGVGRITAAGLETLIERMLGAGKVKKLALPGLSAERAPVFPGGVIILAEIFKALRLDDMVAAEGALREGLLYDSLGRLSEEGTRRRSVRDMERRFHVDQAQADRVEQTAVELLRQVEQAWELTTPLAHQMLRWGARLHEVGLDIAHAQYHRHGAYLLEHSDMPGFPREEQKLLSVLVRYHRRKLSQMGVLDLPVWWHAKTRRLIVLLRLAVLLNRSRAPASLPPLQLKPKAKSLQLRFPDGWLDEHPLTRADLEREARYLKAMDFRLVYVTEPVAK
jgi:exopolyphosphatase/guanosine-5'-triphosphate,3'-diphosphate pyrophosphatase